MDRCFCRQEVRRRHSQRRLAEPLSTSEKTGAIHETGHGMQVFGLHAQARLFAIVLPLCLMFFSHLGCMISRRRFLAILPSTPCVKCRQLESKIRAVMLSEVLSPHLGFTSAGVAPLSPRVRKLLDEIVKTFAVFPSCLQLLDCDDNCVLSVPLSTSDLHYSGEICQVLCFPTCSWYQERFALSFCHFCAIVLPTRLSARCLPSSRPDTASIRSCLLLPPEFLDTREAGNCAGSRACFLLLSLLD